MKISTLSAVALMAFVGLLGSEARADNMASIAITPATGEVTLVPRWALGGNLSGFHHMAQDLSLGGGGNQFYSIKATGIPAGGDISAFTLYIPGSGAATSHADIGSKLTPNSYSALTSADPDLGYGSVQLYFIHHKDSADYFSHIVPSSGTASAVTDLKPMSGPGGPATLGDQGYFGLTFAAANLGYGLNYFYYLRTDPVTGNTQFGTLDPALLGTSALKFDLGTSGYNALAFTGTDVGYGVDKMYYLRLDPITGFTILGTLHPLTGKSSDIANLGSVYSALTYVPGDVGFGSGNFYTTGAVNTTWQSVSFAAITDRLISEGSFTVKPTASSGLPVTLAVVTGSTGAASISGPVAGVYTVTPTGPGVITLQATQAGQLAPATEFNMLRQSFTVTGSTLLAISTQPTSQSAIIGTTANFSVTAGGSSTLSYQWRKAGANITGNASATTAALALSNVQNGDAATYDVVVTNLSGSIVSDPVTLTVTAAAPIITNTPLTAGATVGTPFTFTITASSSPTSYSANPLPGGLSIVAATGVISGTPTTVGTTNVLLGATNATGTGNATLTITVAADGVAPIITNTPLTAAGTVGTPFSFAITASGSPVSYSAVNLPTGLSIYAASGEISGTPTAAGTTWVTLNAINPTGTGTTALKIVIEEARISRIVNFSARAVSGPGDQTLIMGFVVSGDGKRLLARGIGPALAAYGVTNVLTDPMLTLFESNQSIATNDNWELNSVGQAQGPALTDAATKVGAFPLPAGSKDAALIVTVNHGAHTTGLIRPNSSTGIGLTEIYDIDTESSAHLVNVSARMQVTTGENVLIAGFVIAGIAPSTVIIRGVGPALTPFGVAGALPDPQITVYSNQSWIAGNDDWETGTSTATQMNAAFAKVGAFPLPAASKDAALIMTLDPGTYTVIVSGVADTIGVALVEIYDTQ